MGRPSVPSMSSPDTLHGLDWERAGRCRAVEEGIALGRVRLAAMERQRPTGRSRCEVTADRNHTQDSPQPCSPQQRPPLWAHLHTRCPPGPRAAAWRAPAPWVPGPPGTRVRLCRRGAAPRVVVHVTAGQLRGGDMYPGVLSTKPPSTSRRTTLQGGLPPTDSWGRGGGEPGHREGPLWVTQGRAEGSAPPLKGRPGPT